MKILAIDDEKIALEGLVDAIRKAEPSADVYSFRRASEALDFYRDNTCEVVFLDVQMRNMSGVELAEEMKIINPEVNIIFATGYGDYREDAFDMHVSGYLIKPITEKKVRKELDNLRYPVSAPPVRKRVQIHTFGNFEMYVDGNPVNFKYNKTKEMLAYLVDRNGTYCQNAEITAALWQDKTHPSYFSNLRKDLTDTLEKLDCIEIIESERGKLRIRTEEIDEKTLESRLLSGLYFAGEILDVDGICGGYNLQWAWSSGFVAGCSVS